MSLTNMLAANTALVVLTLLIIKHFVFDFVFQTHYMLVNKGTYGHLGGVLHAGAHAVVSGLIIWHFYPSFALVYALGSLEFMIHYHMDWLKCKINEVNGWSSNQSYFWWLTGVDQLVHYLTYVVMIALAEIAQI